MSFRDSNGMTSQTSWYTQTAPALTISQVQRLLYHVLLARTGDALVVLDLVASWQWWHHAASLSPRQRRASMIVPSAWPGA